MSSQFGPLGVRTKLVDTLRIMGIKEPTPVQVQAIPPLMSGKDVIAQAQTGTGKTLAFLLPIFEKIDTTQSFVQALILTPTRELALQITNEAKKLAATMGAGVLATYGGQDVDKQIKRLETGTHIVIATPGRLIDHLQRGTIRLGRLKTLVIDEADQMLHMGFMNDVGLVIGESNPERQIMLCSATMPREVRALAKKFMKQPVEIVVESKHVTLEEINQIVIETTDENKLDALCEQLTLSNPYLAVVFTRTKLAADWLSSRLTEKGFNIDVLHGDLSQNKREQVMRRFREAKSQILVATDIASRGIDVEGVTHVFNFDIPRDVDSYIHRIGRTGRAGGTGTAITFVVPRERIYLTQIEKGIAEKIAKHETEISSQVSPQAMREDGTPIRKPTTRKPGGEVKARVTNRTAEGRAINARRGEGRGTAPATSSPAPTGTQGRAAGAGAPRSRNAGGPQSQGRNARPGAGPTGTGRGTAPRRSGGRGR